VALAQKEFTQHYPKPGWVEHDPEAIWSTQAGVALEAGTSMHVEPLPKVRLTYNCKINILISMETNSYQIHIKKSIA